MQIMHRECRGERKVKGNFQEEHLSRMCYGVTEGSARLVRGEEATKGETGPETELSESWNWMGKWRKPQVEEC